MEIKTTIEYFNESLEELSKVTNEYGYTKEDNMILDNGLKVLFFNHLSNFEDDKKEIINYYNKSDMEIKAVLKTIDNRIAVILN